MTNRVDRRCLPRLSDLLWSLSDTQRACSEHDCYTPSQYDKLKARELMAIAGGELKPRHEHKHSFDHAAFLGAEPPAGDDE